MEPDIPIAQKISPPKPEEPSSQISARAVAALVLGVLSLVCAGFFAGIPAIILGGMELKAIKAKQAPAEGEAIAKIGMILGIIGTALTLLAFLLLIALIAMGISLGASGAFSEITNTSFFI